MGVHWLHLEEADYRVMPWRNGGGTTREIALDPPGGTWDGDSRILWRMSAAEVGTSGPFSLFPGYDRLLCVLEGPGMELRRAGREPLVLRPLEDVGAFPGDDAVEGVLLSGPCRDFNLMVDRSRASASVSRVALGEEVVLRSEGDFGVLFVVRGTCQGTAPDRQEGIWSLKPGESLLWRRDGAERAILALRGSGDVLWGEIVLRHPE